MEEEKKIEEQIEKQENPPEKLKNVFTYKNYTLAFLGALVSNLGNILYGFAVSFYILQLTGNNAFIQGLYLAVGGIVYVVVTLFGGVISDRFHKGKIMFICDYLKGFVLIAFTLLLMFVIQDANSKVIVLFVIAVIGNIIAAIFSPAAASLLPCIVPKKSLQQAQSYYSVMQSGLGIFGVIIAGILYSTLPINTLFLIVGGCYILSGISEMFINYERNKVDERLTLKTVFSDIGIGVKYIFNFKSLLYLMIAVLFINFFFNPITANFIPYFVVTDITGSDYMFKDFLEPEMWSSIISIAFAIGMIIMGIILSTKQKKEHIAKGLRISFAIFVLILSALAVSYVIFTKGIISINTFLIIFVSGCVLTGLVITTINIPSTTTILTITDEDKIGKVSSVVDIGTQGLIPLSSFLAGLVLSGLGSSWLLIICTSGFALITLFILFNKQIAKL